MLPTKPEGFLPAVDEQELDTYLPASSEELETGSIRLVCILPNRPDDSADTIRCRTSVQRPRLGTSSPYLALSYAWGDPAPKHPILVDGKRRLIAENIWQFMREGQTIPEQFSCWLWIDALSIDQTNAEERRHQIGIMSTIFRNAHQVVVWLGPTYDGSGYAMQTLAHMWENGTLAFLRQSHPDYKVKGHEMYYDWPHKDRKLWRKKISNTIAGLCQRPYWKRLDIPGTQACRGHPARMRSPCHTVGCLQGSLVCGSGAQESER